MAKDEMVGRHHQFNGHEFEQTAEDGEGQGSRAYCGSWGSKELDRTLQLKNVVTFTGTYFFSYRF